MTGFCDKIVTLARAGFALLDGIGMEFRIPLLLALVALAPVLRAQEAPPPADELTADELIVRADSAYNKRAFAEAAALYQKFMDSFGEAKEPQVQEVIRRRRYELALSLVQEKEFRKADDVIVAALASEPPLQEVQRQELAFWLGVARMQEKRFEEAREAFESFLAMFPAGWNSNPRYAKDFPAVHRIPEARLLIGTALVLEDQFAEAAAYFRDKKPLLPPQERGRATVLELLSLLQAGDEDAALALVRAEFPNIHDLLQIVSFQTLTLQLGGQFLEQGRYRDAIVCLQRVWLRDRLLKHQRARLEDLESQLAAAEATADPYRKLSLSQQIAKVRREIEAFQEIENFDSALRLRLATAYQAMRRFRESALIMESMLEEMKPDPLVEAASVNLVQSWNEIERWPKVIEAAETFGEVFPNSKSLPLVLYIQGIAQQKNLEYAEAVATFARIAKDHTDSDFAPRARFMKGFTHLLAEENMAAVEAFDELLAKDPKHELADPGMYWRAMAFSLDKQYARAREELDAYLAKHGQDGAFRGAAVFRKAYCAQQLEDYATSIRELEDYLRKFPGGEQSSEARVLLGDALMNEGLMEEGIAAFAEIDPADTRFYEEGVFKTAKALKLMEEYERMRGRMEEFVASSPRSPRVAEAIYNIGWVHRQNNQPEKARDIYWQAIGEYGGDPSIRSVDDLFPALARLYRGDQEQAQYVARLRDLREKAAAPDQPTLAMRALWAQGHALRRRDPPQAREFFLEAAKFADVPNTNPLLLADFAEAFMESGKTHEGETLWRDLVKWNPRAPQKDRALAALGMLELERGNERAALDHFDRFDREISDSMLVGRVMLARAVLLEARGNFDDARQSLESLLESRYATGPEKAEALFRMGELAMKEGRPERAVPYFQRIYVMHGRWADWVARAYLRSGEAFEKLNDTRSARRTYQELAGRPELAEKTETARARERLDALGGPLPDEPTSTQQPAG